MDEKALDLFTLIKSEGVEAFRKRFMELLRARTPARISYEWFMTRNVSEDQKKMANLIECMKGKKRTVERYAYDCKISTTAIYRVIQNSRKRPLLLEQLICLYEHRDPACKVTMEQLFKANGMVLAENGASVKIRAIQSEHEADGMTEETDTWKVCNEFKSLIFSMKGQRNMKQFAKDCGISVSSLNRITTGNR